VAKAITRRMHETGHPHMWLDARHLGEAFWERRFPTILATARQHGIDPVTEPIPVAPAQHYASGGVATDLFGRSSVPGLYATGEVACSGVHGANRLASNSLLEGLVFSRRIADVLPAELRPWADPVADDRPASVVPASVRPSLQALMTEYAGVLRTESGLRSATRELPLLAAERGEPGVEAWENTNLLTLACALAEAALHRQETRGSHWREDFPERDDDHWAGHFDTRLVRGGMDIEFLAAPATDGVVAATGGSR
jgi:L-aspartate oxidase